MSDDGKSTKGIQKRSGVRPRMTKPAHTKSVSSHVSVSEGSTSDDSESTKGIQKRSGVRPRVTKPALGSTLPPKDVVVMTTGSGSVASWNRCRSHRSNSKTASAQSAGKI